MIEARASHKSFRPIDDDEPPEGGGKNPTVDFSGTTRSNKTHRSTTDPDARLCRKSFNTTSQMAYCANVLMENRNGLVIETSVVIASGTAERDAALNMIDSVGLVGGTLGADKGYDAQSFTNGCRERGITPHIAQNNGRRRSSIDGRTTRHAGYEISQRKRKRVEETFGWSKVTGGIRKVKVRGVARVGAVFRLTLAAFNVIRIVNLQRAAV